jgi:hypothetical protein
METNSTFFTSYAGEIIGKPRDLAKDHVSNVVSGITEGVIAGGAGIVGKIPKFLTKK